MRPPHSTYCTCTMRINKYWIHWTLNLSCIFALYDVVLYAFNPFKGRGMGELCINKDVLIVASAGPLIWFFLNNNKLECDALPHRKYQIGKSVKRLNVMSTLSSLRSQNLTLQQVSVVTQIRFQRCPPWLVATQWRDNFINMAMIQIGGKIRFYCRTLGILWYK
jgi:hypothetical protein